MAAPSPYKTLNKKNSPLTRKAPAIKPLHVYLWAMLPPVTMIIIIRGVTEETFMVTEIITIVEEIPAVVEDINDQSKLTSPTLPIPLSATTAAILGIQLQNAPNPSSQLGNLDHVTNLHEGMQQSHQQMQTHKVTQLHQP